MPLPPIDRLCALPDATLAAWAAVLRERGFDEEAHDRLDQIASGALDPLRSRLMGWHLDRHPDPRLRFTMLMATRGSLPAAEVEGFLGADLMRALIEAGLLAERKGRVKNLLRLLPLHGLWVLADDVLNQPDSVMPPGPATVKLCCYMPERMEGAMLDVGCGPGSFALVAAHRGAKHVLGTDVNERAIALARLNARLNRLNVEFRVGDLTVPAEGRRFDLIVSQPPYILRSPRSPDITFLHGGPRGDELARRLLHSLAAVLTKRGEALVIADVPLRKGEDIHGWLRDTLGPTGLDLLVLHGPAPSPEMRGLLYAGFETLEGESGELEATCRQIEQSEEEGIAEFRHTLFVGRRPADGAPNLSATPIEARDTPVLSPATRAQLWASVGAADLPDAALLARPIRVAPGAEWVSRRPEPEGDVAEHRVRFGDDWPAQEQVMPEAGVALASLLQRSATAAEALAGYAELCDATVDEVQAPVVRFLRDGLLTGLLVSAERDR